jgi:hypothetical protein
MKVLDRETVGHDLCRGGEGGGEEGKGGGDRGARVGDEVSSQVDPQGTAGGNR